MKKLTIGILALIFAVVGAVAVYAPAVYAEGIALTDDQMYEIAAGDWVVLARRQRAKHVFFDENELKAEGSAQMELKAVNNANTVDSAAAVQTNVSNATQGIVDMKVLKGILAH